MPSVCVCECVSVHVCACEWAQWYIISPGVHELLVGCEIVIDVCMCVRQRERGKKAWLTFT